MIISPTRSLGWLSLMKTTRRQASLPNITSPWDKQTVLACHLTNVKNESYYPISLQTLLMEQRTLKIVNNCLNSNIYSYLETSGSQSYNLYLNYVHFSIPLLIRLLWQLKTVVFLHWCGMCAVPLLATLHVSSRAFY